MQSSPKKFSTPVSVSVNCKQIKKFNTYTLNFLVYVGIADGFEVMLSGCWKVRRVLILASGLSRV